MPRDIQIKSNKDIFKKKKTKQKNNNVININEQCIYILKHRWEITFFTFFFFLVILYIEIYSNQIRFIDQIAH